jgi:hypothetical protein
MKAILEACRENTEVRTDTGQESREIENKTDPVEV